MIIKKGYWDLPRKAQDLWRSYDKQTQHIAVRALLF
jgi:hypothetical protein